MDTLVSPSLLFNLAIENGKFPLSLSSGNMTSERIIRPLISFSNLVQLIAETWRGGVHSDTLITTQTLNHQHLLLDAVYNSFLSFFLFLSLAHSFSPPPTPSVAYYWLISLKDGCLPFRCSLFFVFFLYLHRCWVALCTRHISCTYNEKERLGPVQH